MEYMLYLEKKDTIRQKTTDGHEESNDKCII